MGWAMQCVICDAIGTFRRFTVGLSTLVENGIASAQRTVCGCKADHAFALSFIKHRHVGQGTAVQGPAACRPSDRHNGPALLPAVSHV
jgi:hypothetical protein